MICFPKSCTNTDLESILEVYLFTTTVFVRNVTYLRHRIVADNYRIFEDFNFYIMMYVFCCLKSIFLNMNLDYEH